MERLISNSEKDIRARYSQLIEGKKLYSGRGYRALNHRCLQVFSHVGDMRNKTMLEIGGGEGFFSLWAVAHGVKRVTILEPEMDGSRPGVGKRLVEWARLLNIPQSILEFLPVTFQAYQAGEKRFDIILSYSSLNHLDERACCKLRTSTLAREAYQWIFQKVRSLIKGKGYFIISDSARLNLWNLFGLRSPFAPSIEWHKHQEPMT